MDELFRWFPAILDELGPNEEIRRAMVFAAWRRTAGELLNERSAAIAFDGKKLVVAVADETWKKHLADLSAQMIYKLNAALRPGAVAFIEFRVDKKAILQKQVKSKKKVSESVDAPI